MFNKLRWGVIARFVDVSGNCLYFLFKIILDDKRQNNTCTYLHCPINMGATYQPINGCFYSSTSELRHLNTIKWCSCYEVWKEFSIFTQRHRRSGGVFIQIRYNRYLSPIFHVQYSILLPYLSRQMPIFYAQHYLVVVFDS